MPQTPARKHRRRPPFFHPVPVRDRKDGWSVERQCAFLGHLYLTGCVTSAARAVGMGRESAHRLRRREGAEGFSHAWDVVLTPPGEGRISRARTDWRKVTDDELFRRLHAGLVAPLIHRGRVTGIRKKPDNSALLRLVRRIDGAASRAAPEAARR